MFTTYFHLKLKKADGTLVNYFTPASDVATHIEISEAEPIVLERENIDFSTDNYLLGFRQVISAKFESVGEKYVKGETGASRTHLENLINAMLAGYVLEYNVKDQAHTGGNYVPCELRSIKRKKLKSKNVGVEVTIELASKAVMTSPYEVS